jgi:catechol 2,3-dioxygenase-like lactoylglutathione lyase family enzyme
MITSIHTLIYSDDANATRAFLRDVLGWKYVAEEFDNNWLIFKSGRARWACIRRTVNGKAKRTITRVTTRSR